MLHLHLQGNLQSVFDALYEMGVIEPVLKMDWKPALRAIEGGSHHLNRAIWVANNCGADLARLKAELAKLDQKTLEVLAMEVAREYADLHTREAVH